MYNKPTQIIAPLLAKFLPRVRIDTGLDLKGITSDKAYRDFLGSDPMSVPLYGSFRQIHDFMQRGAKLYKNENNYIQKNFAKNKPVIIMHGQDDTINDPKGSEKFIQDCPSDDKKLKLYPGAVSYTHLDVYKRQFLHHARTSRHIHSNRRHCSCNFLFM